MRRSEARAPRSTLAVLTLVSLSTSCQPSSGTSNAAPLMGNGGTSGTGGAGNPDASAGGSTPTDGGAVFVVEAGPTATTLSPAVANLTSNPGSAAPPTVTFVASGPGAGAGRLRVTNPALGFIDAGGTFTASGKVGGTTTVELVVDGQVVAKAEVTVDVAWTQNGAVDTDAGGAAAGGLGGVGGEGLGGAVTPGELTALQGAATADPALRWLYPYDGTVFPLNVLPPLLQWSPGGHGSIDAIAVHVVAPPHYEYRGYFSRPAALAASADFLRHSIPRDVWESATTTAAGSTMTVELLVHAGGQTYGPISGTYKIALAKISGKIYYQAYNTALAHNYPGAITGERFGGATLSIDVGAESPELVAGRDSSDETGCRVCHSVSAYGDRMLVQHGEDYTRTSAYDLKAGNQESSPYAPLSFGHGFAGLYPDGSLALSNTVDVMGGVDPNVATLYDTATGAAVPTQGLSEFATKIGLPMFSPDGKHVAFTLFGGASTPSVGTPTGQQLVVMDFDLATRRFSNPRKLWETGVAGERPAWPTFFPSSNALVFNRHRKGTTDEAFASRYGARGELYWIDLVTGQSSPLLALNGTGYLPTGPNSHDQDDSLQFEPTISPVASGGYAWIVFMSRRLYGNVATMDPWWSDPREHNLRDDVTPKKLWMAALDLNPKPGEDPSHPAFYVPGQELHGSNSRPFFALEPCTTDRGTCSTGIDCCSGFCRDGFCVPPPANECSKNEERCVDTVDCCDTRARCIGGFCAMLLQ